MTSENNLTFLDMPLNSENNGRFVSFVFDYLMINKAVMPGVSYRYALEKMDADKKRILMK